MDGCFYTCSCPEDQKVKLALDLIHCGEKDWLKFVTNTFSHVE